MEIPNRSAGETEFINQMTRKKLVDWCEAIVRGIDLSVIILPRDKVYLDFAISKKWMSVDGSRILSTGWETAARFLKR
jgi:hypothetical protein